MTKPSVIVKFRILKGLKGLEKSQKLPLFGKFVTEMLIFGSSRSEIFFKIDVLKNFALLESLSNNVAGLVL